MLTNDRQLILLHEGKVGGRLYQGCHPNVYGHDVAWRAVDVIFDLDNGVENMDSTWPSYPPIMPEGKVYLRWKIEDGDMPSKVILRNIAVFGRNLLLSGHNLLIHCAAGQNRSALVAAAIMYVTWGESGEVIYRRIKRKNPMAFSNYTFRNFVQTIDQHMKGSHGV